MKYQSASLRISGQILAPTVAGLGRQAIHAAGQLADIADLLPVSPFPPNDKLSPPLPPGVPIKKTPKARPPGVSVHPGILAAEQAIDAKASDPRVAHVAGSPLSGLEQVPGGWVRRYQGCDIYYSSRTGAHEVHGDIKAKYDAVLGPAGKLGFPTTDEQESPDKVGRYNYFAHGAIFWTSHTGPMVMGRQVVDSWIANDAQNTLGYPVIDQHRFTGVAPTIEWCECENGGIVQMADGVRMALAATVPPDRLRILIRSTFDAKVHETGDNIGLQPQIETVAVGGWGWGFWASTPRDITFRLHGFHDNGLAADTNFHIDIGLAFDLVWPMSFTEPVWKTLVAQLTFLRVVYEEGADQIEYPTAPGHVVSGVGSGIYKAFYPDTWPDSAHPEVPNGALFIKDIQVMNNAIPNTVDVLAVMGTADGGLQVLLNPLPVGPPFNAGLARQMAAQAQLDALAP